MNGGEIAVIDVAGDSVVKKIKVGTGSMGSAMGLETAPFWKFEH